MLHTMFGELGILRSLMALFLIGHVGGINEFCPKAEHPDLTAEMIIEIYKSRDIVEEGFRALKSDMGINPTYHSKDMRIETHVILVVFGYLLLSLLKVILN